MNKRSVLRTLFIASMLTMLMSISAWASKWGAAIPVAYSQKDLEVTATDDTMLHKVVVPRDGVLNITGVEHGNYSNYGLIFSLLKTNYVPINCATAAPLLM